MDPFLFDDRDLPALSLRQAGTQDDPWKYPKGYYQDSQDVKGISNARNKQCR